MGTLILLGLLLGFDNFLAATGFGLQRLEPRQKLRLALGFVLFEAGMPVIGFLAGAQASRTLEPVTEVAGWLCLLACGILGWAGVARVRRLESALDVKWAALLIPFLLSLDNLAGGVAVASLGDHGLGAAILVGALSASLCTLGLLGGHWIHTRSPRRAPLLGVAGHFGLLALSILHVL